MGDRISLRIDAEEAAPQVKLIWSGSLEGGDWTPNPYCISRGLLKQAADAVREVLRSLPPEVRTLSTMQYKELMEELTWHGKVLANNIFPGSPGDNSPAQEARQLLHDYLSADGSPRLDLRIELGDETVHVPWSFVFDGDETTLDRRDDRSIRDLVGFWGTSFRVSGRLLGGTRLRAGKREVRLIQALHEDLFARARAALDGHDEFNAALDVLLRGSLTSTKWRECRRLWEEVRDKHDTILHIYGHSNGTHILLADNQADIDSRLTASSFSTYFPTHSGNGSVSVCILNGCFTAAPTDEHAWPAGFLSATRRPGFFGFIGTETQVRNDLALLYGTELLTRICHQGETLGEAYDKLQSCPAFYPHSLLYSCFADRNFRVVPPAEHPSVKELSNAF